MDQPSSPWFPSVLNALPGAIYWKDRQFVYQGCNQAFANVAGLLHPDAIIGKTDADLPWTAEQTAYFRLADARVMDTNTPEARIHEPITRADGTHGWVESSKAPLHGPDGRVIGVVGSFVEIPTQKTPNLEHQRLSAVVEHSNDFIGLATLDGQAIYVNPAGRRMVGLADLDAVRQTQIPQYFAPEDLPFVEQVVVPTVMQAGRWEGEYRFRNFVTGAIIPVHYALFTVHDQATGQPIGIACISRDLTEQRQLEADRQRARSQEEIIQAQRLILAELSTPLIPITDEIVIMPLIGTLDSHRAQQVMDALLHGVATQRARTAIVDITGVPVVDTQVANALLRATQAVQLLGARVLLTGIRSEVAQTLVRLGVDLRTVQTYSTLQQGIAAATQSR
jgi:rsbT co-antagonist protein RsbR